MQKYNWNYPTTIWVGKNRIEDLVNGCKQLKIKKPLFVTDKDLINLPMSKNIIENCNHTVIHVESLLFEGLINLASK